MRPTGAKVREAIANSLQSAGAVEGAAVVDLCAGSGALGFELLSRGASHVTFVDSDIRCVESIRSTAAALGVGAHIAVRRGDVVAVAASLGGGIDVAVCDPPYDFDRWNDLFGAVDAQLLVVESDRDPVVPAEGSPWQVARERRFGRTWVTTLVPGGHGESDGR